MTKLRDADWPMLCGAVLVGLLVAMLVVALVGASAPPSRQPGAPRCGDACPTGSADQSCIVARYPCTEPDVPGVVQRRPSAAS